MHQLCYYDLTIINGKSGKWALTVHIDSLPHIKSIVINGSFVLYNCQQKKQQNLQCFCNKVKLSSWPFTHFWPYLTQVKLWETGFNMLGWGNNVNPCWSPSLLDSELKHLGQFRFHNLYDKYSISTDGNPQLGNNCSSYFSLNTL